MTCYATGKPIRFPRGFAETEEWFEEWLMGMNPSSRRGTPARKWSAFVLWNAMWKKLPLDIERAKNRG